MLWFVYNVLFTVGYVLMLPKFLLRMKRRGGYRRGFMQRFACYPDALRKRIRERPRIWVHAVSVGEMFVAQRYMRDIRAQRPGTGFVLTTTTSTGHRLAEARLHADDVLLYYPSDFPLFVRRALATVRPLALLLTESEIWPNMIRSAADRGIPVILINGRISEGSYRGYRALRVFFGKIVSRVSLALVQSEGDRQRLVALGGRVERIRVLASAKYDVAESVAEGEAEARAFLAGLGWRGTVTLLGGSTWPGEEETLLAIYGRLRGQVPGLRLVLVPRHAERGDDVAAVVRAKGLRPARRSQPEAAAVEADPDVLLVDTTGELRDFYACADVIFVGKSLCSTGGQNIIEPAALGKPVVVGPHMENFPVVIRDFLDEKALLQVADARELEAGLRRLVSDPDRRASLGKAALKVVESKRGAVAEGVRQILSLIRPAGDDTRPQSPCPAAPDS